MKIQHTDWGYIEWLHQREDNSAAQSMNVGRTFICPHSRQVSHVHYGQEQMIYILSGEGLYRINGVSKRYAAGSVIYMPAGTQHETINDTDAPICELLVSNPVGGSIHESIDTFKNMHAADNSLYAIVENLRAQFIDPLKMPLTIFDSDWKKVYQTPYFPEFCRRHCQVEAHPEQCACMKACCYVDGRPLKETICPMGLRIYSVPLIHNQCFMGTVRGGFILLSESKEHRYEGLYDMPQSAALSIQKMLIEVSTVIINYCVFNDTRRELEKKEKVIQCSLETGARLKENLQIAQDTVTNLKINHHFLFNTLNSMASLALQNGAEQVYDSIIDLAELFRYTMKTDKRFVPFEQELSYLNNYLNLQKLRYRNDLTIIFDLTDDLLGVATPFNSLQPIVENAFIHGFGKEVKEKVIRIRTHVTNKRAVITISNNGAAIDSVDLNRINKSLSKGSHGLSMIFTKLKAAFAGDFEMRVYSEKNQTGVIMEIPLMPIEECVK